MRLTQLQSEWRPSRGNDKPTGTGRPLTGPLPDEGSGRRRADPPGLPGHREVNVEQDMTSENYCNTNEELAAVVGKGSRKRLQVSVFSNQNPYFHTIPSDN